MVECLQSIDDAIRSQMIHIKFQVVHMLRGHIVEGYCIVTDAFNALVPNEEKNAIAVKTFKPLK